MKQEEAARLATAVDNYRKFRDWNERTATAIAERGATRPHLLEGGEAVQPGQLANLPEVYIYTKVMREKHGHELADLMRSMRIDIGDLK